MPADNFFASVRLAVKGFKSHKPQEPRFRYFIPRSISHKPKQKSTRSIATEKRALNDNKYNIYLFISHKTKQVQYIQIFLLL